MSFVKPEPRIKEEVPDDSSQIPVRTISDPASVQVKQEKHYDGGGVEGTAPARSSFQDAAASSSSSSSRWVGAPGKAKQEPQATVTQVRKKSGVRKRPHGMIYNEVKRRIKVKTPPKCDVPPKASLPSGTAEWADPEQRKIKFCVTERTSGLRYIYWENGRRRWVVKYWVHGAQQPAVYFYTGKWCAEGFAFEEAVAMALEEAKSHLARVRDRPSGVRCVSWIKRRFCWWVRVRRRNKNGVDKYLEDKLFFPTDKSDEAVARALKEAAAHAAKVHARYGIIPWKDKSRKALESASKKARAHLNKRPVETRGITWHKHDLAWRVKLKVRSPKKKTEYTEDKRFPPKDTSDEEMHRTLEEARAHLIKLRGRSNVVEDKRVNPKKKSEQAVARALEETRAEFAKLRGRSSGVAGKRLYPKDKSEQAAARALEEARADSTRHPGGIRGVSWHKRYFAWRIRLRLPSAAGRAKRVEYTCFRPKDKSDEAVARALEEATAHLTKLRGRLSGEEDKKDKSDEAMDSRVCGVTWSERHSSWRVRFEPIRAGKRMWMSKLFPPEDESEAAIEEARQKAVQWRRVLEVRYQLFSTGGGRVLSKRGHKGLSKPKRQQER